MSDFPPPEILDLMLQGVNCTLGWGLYYLPDLVTWCTGPWVA